MHRTLLLLFILPLTAWSQKIKSGDRLPGFRLTAVSGDSVTPSSLKGKKVLLMFNRYVSCPLCNYRAHEVLSMLDSLKDGQLVVVSVYESTRQSLKEYSTGEQIPFLMIADPELKLYRQFNIRKSWFRTFTGLFNDYSRKHGTGRKQFKKDYKRDGSLNRIDADFLIDENGVIQVAYYGRFAGDHLPIADILKWIR